METVRPFGQRVAEIRERWEDARRAAHYGQLRDREAQLELIALFYKWAGDAAAEIQRVYEEQIEVQLSRFEAGHGGHATGFMLTIGDGAGLACFAEQVADLDQWRVAIATRTSRQVEWTGIRPERPGWTRGRLEDLLLDLVATFERSRSNSSGYAKALTDELTGEEVPEFDRPRRSAVRRRFANLPVDLESVPDR